MKSLVYFLVLVGLTHGVTFTTEIRWGAYSESYQNVSIELSKSMNYVEINFPYIHYQLTNCTYDTLKFHNPIPEEYRPIDDDYVTNIIVRYDNFPDEYAVIKIGVDGMIEVTALNRRWLPARESLDISGFLVYFGDAGKKRASP